MSERDGEAARRSLDGSDGSRLPLSCCIIACNEERGIRRCLESVCFADDCVVVIDSRSSDATEEIAREFGARVIEHPYQGNVEQKNFALAQAKRDWVLSLDADEAITEMDGATIDSCSIKVRVAQDKLGRGYGRQPTIL